MKEILEKLLTEVDQDIREVMLKDSGEEKWKGEPKYGNFLNWQLIHDPIQTVLSWQARRDMQRMYMHSRLDHSFPIDEEE